MNIKLGNILYAVVQIVGSKSNGDGVSFSSEKIDLSDVKEYIFQLLDNSFKYEEMKHLDFVGGVQLNPVYNFVTSIFEDEKNFVKEANNLATYLYQQSLHPSIKNGEFYVVKITDCIVDNKKVDAVGLFKSEIHDTILKTIRGDNGMQIVPEKGMSLKKLNKGCIIFNMERENGYLLSVLDTNSRDAKYWTDAFLHAVPCNDDYHETMNYINFCKEFVSSDAMENTPKAERAIVINKAVDFLENADNLNFMTFIHKLFGSEMNDNIVVFKEHYEQIHNVELKENIQPSKDALKKKISPALTTIKLDDNFDIRIKRNCSLLEQGVDNERGLKYYKLYYSKEK